MNKRVIWFDYLRVLATFAVIVLHVAAQNWRSVEVNTVDWQVFNVFDSLTRWSVPVFVMISGALFLDRECDIKKLYSKNILRMFTAFVFWSVIYALVNGTGKFNMLIRFISGHYHMWFIPMIIGMYMCVPIIKKVTDSKKATEYFLKMAFVFSFMIPFVVQLIGEFAPQKVVLVANTFNSTINCMNLYIVFGYVCYFIGGYYLNSIELKKKTRYVIYALGLLGAVATIGMTAYFSAQAQKPVADYYDNFSLNVMITAVALFVFAKNEGRNSVKWLDGIVVKLSKYSFGAYLIHVLIIQQLDLRLGLNTLSFNSAIAVPAISVVVFFVSFGISAALNNIPFLKKYIV